MTHYEIWKRHIIECVYWYKNKQCKILLAHTGLIQSLATPTPPLIELAGHIVDPVPETSVKVPGKDTGRSGQPTSAEQNAAMAAACNQPTNNKTTYKI